MVQVSLAHIKKADEPGPAPSLGTAPARPFAPVPGKGLSKLVTNKDAALEKFLLRKQGTLAPQQMELVSMAQRKIAETPAERLSGATVWKKVQREDRAGAAAQSLPRSRRKQKGDGKKQRGRGSGAGQGGQSGAGRGGGVAARLVIGKTQRRPAAKSKKQQANTFGQAVQEAKRGPTERTGSKPSILSRLGNKQDAVSEQGGGKPVTGCPGWAQYRDDEGTPYYFNLVTEATQWELPTRKQESVGGSSGSKPAVLARLGRVYK